MTRILPYLDQESLWQGSLQAFSQDPFFRSIPHRPILGTRLSVYSCPADGRTSQPWASGPVQIGLTSYQGVSGTDHLAHDGLFFLDSRIRFADVIDGTSNTLAVGERPPSADYNFGWWYAGWGQARDGSVDLYLGASEYNVWLLYQDCPPGPHTFKEGDITSNCDAFHFWSLHRDGANFLLVDGSVRFSSYGGSSTLPALATRSGGEVVEIP